MAIAPEGTPATRPRNRLKTIIVANGWRMAHAAPRTVCLYRTLTSRQVKK